MGIETPRWGEIFNNFNEQKFEDRRVIEAAAGGEGEKRQIHINDVRGE